MLDYAHAQPAADTLISEAPVLSDACFRYPISFDFDITSDAGHAWPVTVTVLRIPERDRWESDSRTWFRGFIIRCEFSRSHTLFAGATTEAADVDGLVSAAQAVSLASLRQRARQLSR